MPRRSRPKQHSLLAEENSLLVCSALIKGRADHLILRMVVDTGSNTTTIPVEAALSLGLDPTMSKEKVGIITASGVVYAPIVQVPLFGALGIERSRFKAACHDLPPQSRVRGLLGVDFLQYFPPYQEFRKQLVQIAPQFWR